MKGCCSYREAAARLDERATDDVGHWFYNCKEMHASGRL